ncbi:thioredoxin domain-containing protein [Thiobacillus sp. 65-1402]|uniref:thioredoxin domain-containing protein n=1 Tax=Thiobacillus sp. 65-1402 TaxID=1895861 RepID=UPI000964A8F8|nr:thioredoxin domain-containing protein [Thiobacillus sp. 65-1402]OJW93313.1 MAG: thioredoxin domain-containing protein [Thiobacillus sp. 65-1402]
MPNRLATEPSPYLLQHADNPVDWYPWGEEALEKARREDKPILLSIGYSACHWCHVMAHECFEDAEVAAVMNRLFVNIKVDREERPDLDQIYQAAHQLLAQRGGGWPLTVFLAPDQTPFFAGTYFPKTPRYRLPGFIDLMENVARAWRERRGEVLAQNAALRDTLAQQPPEGSGQSLSAAPFAAALHDLAQAFDPVWGGFSPTPKFPRPGELFFLLRESQRGGSAQAREMALFTLRKMASGGVRDQLGGGFCRYSVDAQWAIPHFEKMLYDNGPLLHLYADAWALTGEALFRDTAEGIVEWLLREMRAPDGGFYSALDADSEGHEGRFYVWTPDQVRALLSTEEYAVAAPVYGFDLPPNFENGSWNPILARPLADVAAELGLTAEAAAARLASARARLFAARETRVRPGRDDKQLTSWNALMIGGLAHAGRVMNRTDWVEAAHAAIDFLHVNLWRDGRLCASFQRGEARLNAYLDDYAFLLDALLEALQARYREADMAWACELADALLAHFEDPDAGGFFFTSHDHEALIIRPKPGYDNATPSGNGVAAFALQRLGHLLGEARYLDAGARCLSLFYAHLGQQPVAYPTLLAVLDEALAPPRTILLRGPESALRAWVLALTPKLGARDMLLALPNGLSLPQALAKPEPDRPTAWVCGGTAYPDGYKCRPPLTDLAGVLE